ncbi:MAG: molybdopterin biosynthesis protein [Candidatus Eremiobacteraeota bacterium]|nr:molybdopterin biosynthesis protein [Candidatus Eremiobacteraeota bacterium]MCW5870495.1 molybdopterin biosynthesis protein [Candidatus Eremiobacteraeota bacterium]
MAESVMDSNELGLQEWPAEEALDRFLSELEFHKALRRPEHENVPLAQALKRITSRSVAAAMDSPHYYSAAIDGLLVRSAETFTATRDHPVELSITSGNAFVEMGSPVPEGYDAVVPLAELEATNRGTVILVKPSNPWRNVRPAGEDVQQNEVVIPKDHRIQPVDIGALAAAGVEKLDVYQQPAVAILSLGNHLVPAGSKPQVGQMIDSNSLTLSGLVQELGAIPEILTIAPERLEEAGQALKEAAQKADLILTVAGPSHGTALLSRLVCDLGERILHGVALNPCQSLVLGVIGGKPLIGLPFHPVGVFAGFESFARPVLEQMLGPSLSQEDLPRAQATLAVPFKRNYSGSEEFVRVRMGWVDDRLVAVPEVGGASTLMSLVRASGLFRVNADVEELPARTNVSVRMLSPQRSLHNNVLVLGTHDICFDLLRSLMRASFPELTLHTAATGGMKGLQAIKAGLCHAAAIHLFDEETGEYNVPFLEGAALPEPMVLMNLCSRDLGLIVAPGNPLKIEGLQDLGRSDLKFINRQKGSGTRVLLDWHLRKLGLNPEKVGGFPREVKTHMAVAAAVSSQAVDCGPGISTAARTLRLDFVPCIKERLDLLIPKRFFARYPVAGLVQVIRSSRFKSEAPQQLSDYDFSQTGQVLWESPT